MSVKNRVVGRQEYERAIEILAKYNNLTKEEMRKRLDTINAEVLKNMVRDDKEEEQLLDSACKDRRDSLVQFTDTGETSKDLLNHIENCQPCSSVVEFMFKRQAVSFEESAKRIREDRNKKL